MWRLTSKQIFIFNNFPSSKSHYETIESKRINKHTHKLFMQIDIWTEFMNIWIEFMDSIHRLDIQRFILSGFELCPHELYLTKDNKCSAKQRWRLVVLWLTSLRCCNPMNIIPWVVPIISQHLLAILELVNWKWLSQHKKKVISLTK